MFVETNFTSEYLAADFAFIRRGNKVNLLVPAQGTLFAKLFPTLVAFMKTRVLLALGNLNVNLYTCMT